MRFTFHLAELIFEAHGKPFAQNKNKKAELIRVARLIGYGGLTESGAVYKTNSTEPVEPQTPGRLKKGKKK